jgi:hypothetical protein
MHINFLRRTRTAILFYYNNATGSKIEEGITTYAYKSCIYENCISIHDSSTVISSLLLLTPMINSDNGNSSIINSETELCRRNIYK